MSAQPPTNLSKRTMVLLGVILLVAAALRFWHIGRSGLWLDEYMTVMLSNGHGLAYMDMQGESLMQEPPDYVHLDRAKSLASIWSESRRDVHPPLFYVVLRIWRSVFPDTDGWIRTLSAICSLVAIVMLFIAVSAVGGSTAGLWAALLMALAGPQIEYAQENRSYTLLLATLLGACAALLRIERFGFTRKRAAALGLCVLAAALTHYAALPLIAVLGLYALLRLRGPSLKGTVGALLIAGVVYAVIWGPFALVQFRTFSEQTRFTQANPKFNVITTLLLLPLRFFSTTGVHATAVGRLGIVIFLIPAFLIRRRPELLFWWLWLVVGVGVVFLNDVFRHGQALYWIRYTLAASPGAYALAAMMLTHLDGWSRHIIPMTLALSSIAALEGAYDSEKPKWQEMAEFIDSHLQPGDVLIIGDLDEEHWLARSDMVALNFYARTSPITTAIMAMPPDPSLRQQLMSAKQIWVFTNGMRSAAAKLFPEASFTDRKFISGVGTMVRMEFNHASSSTTTATTIPALIEPSPTIPH